VDNSTPFPFFTAQNYLFLDTITSTDGDSENSKVFAGLFDGSETPTSNLW